MNDPMVSTIISIMTTTHLNVKIFESSGQKICFRFNEEGLSIPTKHRVLMCPVMHRAITRPCSIPVTLGKTFIVGLGGTHV